MDNYLSPYELALRDSAVRKWLSDDSEDTEMRRLRLALLATVLTVPDIQGGEAEERR